MPSRCRNFSREAASQSQRGRAQDQGRHRPRDRACPARAPRGARQDPLKAKPALPTPRRQEAETPGSKPRTDCLELCKSNAVGVSEQNCNSTTCETDHPEVSTAKAKRIHAADEGQRLLHGSRAHAAATIKSGTRISLVALTCQRHHQASQRWTAGPRRQADYVEAHTFIERHRLDDRAALQTILPEHWACWRRLCSQAVCFLL